MGIFPRVVGRWMAAFRGADLLLFVAGEPGPAPDPMQDVARMIERITGPLGYGWLKRTMGNPSQTSDSRAAPLSEGPPWHLPMPQVQCVNLVLDIAQDLGRTVALIDVNHPTGYEEQVRRWIASEPVLPVLVRRDGRHIEGTDQFVPRKVRRFIRGE